MDKPNTFHGHDVMQMMIESGKIYTRQSLLNEIRDKFGEDATFYTCSAKGMDAEGIVAFLESRGKFTGPDSGFRTDPDKICNH